MLLEIFYFLNIDFYYLDKRDPKIDLHQDVLLNILHYMVQK